MDFLDPKHKKSHRRRLLIGYFLTAIAIAMTTLILLFSAYGFDIDRKTGSVIHNGTVFVDSNPVSATVFLNDIAQNSQTSTRLVIPGGQYTLKLTSNGYRDWLRTFSIDGGKIERIDYPLLIPKELKPSDARLYDALPQLATQSMDQRWLLVLRPGQSNIFDLYDLTGDPKTPTTISLPANVLTNPGSSSTMRVVEWSDDDRYVLIDRSFDNKHEYIVINTENPAATQNLNTVLGITPNRVSFRDKKSDQFYIYDSSGGILRSADLKNRTISGPIISGVLNYASFGPDIILYATKEGALDGKVDFRIRENDKTSYLLKSVPNDNIYLLAIDEYADTPYFVVGSNADDEVAVYKDPLPALKGQTASPLLVTTVIRLTDPQFVSFAPKGQFIIVQKDNKFKSYDIFSDRQHQLDLAQNVESSYQLRWQDTHHLVLTDSTISYILDFDGSNVQPLISSFNNASGPFFSPDFESVYSLAPSVAAPDRPALINAPMTAK